LEVDHKVPKSDCGSDQENNLVAACRECNIGKGRYAVVDYNEDLGPELMDCIRKDDHARAIEILGGDLEQAKWLRRYQKGEFDEELAKRLAEDLAKPDE